MVIIKYSDWDYVAVVSYKQVDILPRQMFEHVMAVQSSSTQLYEDDFDSVKINIISDY